MSQLIGALQESIPSGGIRLNSQVQRLTKAEDHWVVTENSGQSFPADAVVVATPARKSSTMLQGVDDTIANELRMIEYASCAVIALGFRREQIKVPLNSFGFVVPQVENQCILSCSFSSEKYAGRASEGNVLMRVFVGGAMQPGLLRLPNTELIKLAHQEVSRLLKIEGEPILRHVTRQTHAMPQYHVGHKARISKIHTCLEKHPTLALAGSPLNGVGVPGCIESGQKAAARVLAGLSRAACV